ncbi:MAG: hypothetical protein ABIK44_07345 [candidate division WOR-3 bacterium]
MVNRKLPQWDRWFLFGLRLYILAFLLFYPRIFAIVDEDAYLTQALLFRSGRLSYTGSAIPAPHMTVNMTGRMVSKYPPGNALFLLPFTLPGWRWVFLSGIVLALSGTWLCVLVLRQFAPDSDPAWALLFLCHPAVTVYSRTIMSDLLATVAIMASFYFLFRSGRWSLLSGLCLGFAILTRYASGVLVPVFILFAFLLNRHRWEEVILFLLGLVPFLAAALAYNRYAFGGPFRFPMFLTGHFSVSFLARNFLYYFPPLLVWYPLMLPAPILAGRRAALLLGLPAWTVLFFYSLFSYIPPTSGLADRLVIGLRYLLPAIPFLTLGFILALHRLKPKTISFLKPVLLTLALTLSTALQFRHAGYLRHQDYYRQLLYKTVPDSALLYCDREVSELISFAWGWREHRPLTELDTLALSEEIRPVFAARLTKKPDGDFGETAQTFSPLAGRSPILETSRPYRFQLFRLR